VKVKLPARVACKSMNRVQEQKHHLALANRHIAELTVQIVRQRIIVKQALDTGQRSAMAESLLDALEGSLRLFEKHRVLILGQLQRNGPNSGIRAPRPATGTRRAGTATASHAGCGANDQDQRGGHPQ